MYYDVLVPVYCATPLVSNYLTPHFPCDSISQDSVWGVSGTGSQSRYQSNHTSLQQQARFETVTSGKKKKKQKMVRADPSLLGEDKYNYAFFEGVKSMTVICYCITFIPISPLVIDTALTWQLTASVDKKCSIV